MATLRERFNKWKETRSRWQKAGDIFFWILLLMLLIPGPRRVISTAVNRVAMIVKTPGILPEDEQVILPEEAYQWNLVSDGGERYSLEDLKGEALFVNFWATWCPPCVAELPEIEKAYQKHGDQVNFLLVTNQEPEVVSAFLEKRGYDIPVAYQASALPSAFSHRSIPTTYLISRSGKVLARKTGAINWDSRASDRIFREMVR
jgi:thiol-disulfide isomerase/thioredoxin